jgi:hypothetical protein
MFGGKINNMNELFPVLVRVDRFTFCESNLNIYEKTERCTSIQFLPCKDFTIDDFIQYQKWVGTENVKVIMVSRKTFDAVNSHKSKFSIHYDQRGWHCAEKLDAETRNELLTKTMTCIKGNCFLEVQKT